MHVSLDSALGRQRRLNSVGESVLQIAPNAAAAYSLRSLTGGDPKVVRVRREIDNAESDFTAAGISSGALTSFVNDIQTVGTAVNGTGSFDNYTVSNLSNTGFSADNSAGGTGSAGFPYVFKDEDILIVKYTVTNFSSTASLSPQIRGVSATNSVTGKTNSGTAFTANGTYTDVLTATADGTHLMFADGNTGSYTISDFEIVSHSSSGFVETWYDQSGNSKDATQATANLQPKIVNAGSLLTDGIDFDGTDQVGLVTGSFSLTQAFTTFSVSHTDDASTSLGIWATAASATSNFNVTALFRSDDGFAVNAGSTLTTAGTIDYVADRTYLQTNVVNGSSSSIFVDGATGKTGNAGSTNPSGVLIIGYFKSGAYFNLDGAIKEVIIYDSDQTSNRAALEANIAAANGVTLS